MATKKKTGKSGTVTIYVVGNVQRKVGREFVTGPMLLRFEAIRQVKTIKIAGAHAQFGYRSLFMLHEVHVTSEAAIDAWKEERAREVEELTQKLAAAKAAREAVIDTSDPGYVERRFRE